MSAIGEFARNTWTILVPLAIGIATVSTLLMLGYDRPALQILNLLWPVVILGNLIYVIFFHSKSRWPGVGWKERAYRLFTFHR